MIIRGGAELLDAVRPLWLAMRDHHHMIAPERGPVRGDEDSWARRSGQYRRWLGSTGAFLLVARAGEDATGYAMVRPGAHDSPTWKSPGRIAQLESLSVAPAARGAGCGAALLARVREEIRALGYDQLHLTALAANTGALRFYDREGFSVMFHELVDTAPTE